MCKSRLPLNDMPLFHENVYKIRCCRVIRGNKRQNHFRLLCFVTRSFCSVGELNFSQDFLHERNLIASLLKISFVFIKILFD